MNGGSGVGPWAGSRFAVGGSPPSPRPRAVATPPERVQASRPDAAVHAHDPRPRCEPGSAHAGARRRPVIRGHLGAGAGGHPLLRPARRPVHFQLDSLLRIGSAALPLFVTAGPGAGPRGIACCCSPAPRSRSLATTCRSRSARVSPRRSIGCGDCHRAVMIAALRCYAAPASTGGARGRRSWHCWRDADLGGLNGRGRLAICGEPLQVLAGAFSWSCYTVLAARLNRRHGALGVTGAMSSSGRWCCWFSRAVGGFRDDAGLATVAMLAAMGVTSSLLGFLFWNYAGSLLPTERLGMFLDPIPVVSIVAGAGFLAETLTLAMLSGGGARDLRRVDRLAPCRRGRGHRIGGTITDGARHASAAHPRNSRGARDRASGTRGLRADAARLGGCRSPRPHRRESAGWRAGMPRRWTRAAARRRSPPA